MITSKQAKRIGKLRTRKRREEGAFLVEGVRLVEELLASDLEVELAVVSEAVSTTERGRDILATVRARGVPLAEVADRELRGLADTETPQGILAVAVEPVRRLTDYDPAERAAVLVFDRIADPGNLGTLVRTAHALGVGWAVATPGSVDPWGPKTVRASAGSLFRLPVSREPWPEVLVWLRERQFTILCADPGGEPVPHGGSAPARFALLLGSEPSGLSAEVEGDCDARVAVRLPGGMDSLNVAISGALILDRLLAGSGH